MMYDLELKKAVEQINKLNISLKSTKFPKVCIQLPDGLKPSAKEITDFLQKQTNAKITIWAGTCFGACDTPDIEKFGFDLLIQWGHSKWN